MTRQIKFRAWDGKKMIGVGKNDWFSIRNDGLPSCSFPIVIMQFTGLHDKNGKEIYEGDKISFICNYAHQDGTPVKNEVWVNNGCFMLDVFPLSSHNFLNIEVIGNIYEEIK
jgi:hypothetical protein